MKKFIQTVDGILVKFQQILLLISTSAMTLLIIWQVIARRILHLSTPYAEELARLGIVWCVFIGAALAVRFNDHAKMDVLLNKMPLIPQTILRVIIDALIAVFAFIVVRYGAVITAKAWTDITTTLQYPRGFFYLPSVLSGCLMFIYSLSGIVQSVINFKNKIKERKEVQA